MKLNFQIMNRLKMTRPNDLSCSPFFRMTAVLAILVCGIVFPTLLLADGLESVTVGHFDGSEFQGGIQAIGEDGLVTSTGIPATMRMQDIVSIKTSRTVSRDESFDTEIRLIGGGVIFVRGAEISDEKVLFRSNSGLTEVPLQNLAAVIWRLTPNVKAQYLEPSTDKDTVLAETADGEIRVPGIVEGLNREQLMINYEGRSETISLEKLNGLIMANLGLKVPEGSKATIEMTDGSKIIGVMNSMVDGLVSVRLAGGSSLGLDANRIVGVSIKSDRLQYLSDLEPIETQQRTEFTALRPWQRDLSVGKNRLSIRYGESERLAEFNKGLGTQAFTQLAFANSGNFDQFNAVVGIDAETFGKGDCQMVIRGDGIELWSQRVRGTDDPREVQVDISGIQKISLVVYPGEQFDLADHADWCNARFVKTK